MAARWWIYGIFVLKTVSMQAKDWKFSVSLKRKWKTDVVIDFCSWENEVLWIVLLTILEDILEDIITSKLF